MAKKNSPKSKAKSMPPRKAVAGDLSNGGSADAPIDISSSPKKEVAEKATRSKGSPGRKKKEMSPTSKKRALKESELEQEQEPTSKKTKASPAPTTPKKEKNGSPATGRSPSPSDQAATVVDKANWQGFCEIESDPAYFSVILREIGVRGITVREVPFLDPGTLSMIPNPIFGLILLFRHREFDLAAQEKTCPSNVWFANQMPGQNSCATLAMIHALLNVSKEENPDVDIGEHMRQFKQFTSTFTPFQRGEAFASWNYVKKIHNSFAKEMDILENDKHLAHKVNKAKKEGKPAKPGKERRHSADSNATDDSADSFEENAHHYIAFVPIAGSIWKLDGMDAQPTLMGSYDAENGENWLDAISDRIMALMAAGDDDYGVYAIAQCPLAPLRRQICEGHNTFRRVERRLAAINTDWKSFATEEETQEPSSPSFLADMAPEELAGFPVPEDVEEEIDEEEMSELVVRRTCLVREITEATMQYVVEEAQVNQENQAAEERRWDYGPAIKKWMEMLAENGFLEENLHLFPLEDRKKK
ncbi:cysteine proteinase [Trematosphaeria pertusa]|uniref:Ubiquitin carboxyl-terminal hydrolase n=1 Tax=Trematosphaeria pertusa TaxID=390896 RepID=A0A6A6IQQ0_9PLEO|nr:cysteine proteinase [Trematosphaeria pertusa]KAF2252537.1 cysteine proteinase [Trematosphaeria pertusa]